jgi:hypothetical protein
MIFRVVSVAALALLLGAGCTTDVVDFALEQELICKEPLDDAGSKTCRFCWWSADPQTICEICGDPANPTKDSCHVDGGIPPELFCKQSSANCKTCWWSDKPKEQCKICWGTEKIDTCKR